MSRTIASVNQYRHYEVETYREGEGFERTNHDTQDDAVIYAKTFCAQTPWPVLARASVYHRARIGAYPETIADFSSEMYRRMNG